MSRGRRTDGPRTRSRERAEQRQHDLLSAVRSASDDPAIQRDLLHKFAGRIGASEGDRRAVERAIIGGPVVECAG
jgi:hypothetical protein